MKIEWKIAVRPEEHQEKGCVRSIIKDDLYPDLEVQAITPRFYYHKKYHSQDEYSKILLQTKETCKDESTYFKPFILDCLNKFKNDLRLEQIDVISLIPNGNNKYYPNIIGVAEIISHELGKPIKVLFDRQPVQKSVERGRQNRYHDLHGKFTLKLNDLSGKTILLIDDIRSSGISVLECAEVLKKAGVLAVVSFALGTNNSNSPIIKGDVKHEV
jgi:predicted amidophosphoribosyltransferase